MPLVDQRQKLMSNIFISSTSGVSSSKAYEKNNNNNNNNNSCNGQQPSFSQGKKYTLPSVRSNVDSVDSGTVNSGALSFGALW